MRLLQRKGDGSFELGSDLANDALPTYAILSHTWLVDNDQEVTFQDITLGNNQPSKEAGYAKIRFCADQAAKDGLQYFWVDTCCINKESSTELQEAITSMFAWYRDSAKCYVYLTDVSAPDFPSQAADADCESKSETLTTFGWEKAFRQSKWFTRGWTLQELLAPTSVEFFSREGTLLGTKVTLQDWLHDITGIPRRALQGQDLAEFSVNEKFSWAENRQTKRREDQAYCLIGIFNLFLPLMYGEGDHAFTRLRKKIKNRDRQGEELDEEVLSSLPIAWEASFNSINNQHEPTCLLDTRTELLGEIRRWVESEDSKRIFWLSGIAGTGKSTVARTIARVYHDQELLGASFFFSKGGGDASNADQVITTIARQMATRFPATKPHIVESVRRHKNIAELCFLDQWNELIVRPLSKIGVRSRSCPQTIVLVIDAMDECDNERDIRALLRVFATSLPLTNIWLRIFLTSRPEIAIRHTLGKIPSGEREVFVLHEISDEIVNRDLSVFFESSFSVIRGELGLDDDCPGKGIIDRLVRISGGLFIWASTACRFIHKGKRLWMKRLKLLLNGHREGGGPQNQLDQIYTTVIHHSIHEDSDYTQEEKAELRDGLRQVLGSIALLLSPVSIISLAWLIDMDVSEIKTTLAHLHTIFHIPSQTSSPIRLHHPTFRDFLLDKERSSGLDFSVDEKQGHLELAEGCLRVMEKMLRRDICRLGSPGTLVKDVDPGRIAECISEELQYACLYWVQHYRRSGKILSDGDHVYVFFQSYFLYWVEAICLMGKSSEMRAIIRLYHSILEPTQNHRQIPFVKDARRFLFTFQNIIKLAPLQTYCAALAFLRPTNQLKHHFRNEMHPWIKDLRVIPADVPKAKDEFNYVNDLAFTPDGRQIASGSNEEVAKLWDVPSKAALWKFEGPTDKVSTVAISPDATKIAAGSDDFTVMVWDLNTRALRYAIHKAHMRWVNSVIFSPNGKLLASGSMDETVAIWDAATGNELMRFDNQSGPVNTAAFSPDGSLIATGSFDQMIRIWYISRESQEAELRLMLDGHSGCVNSVRFSPKTKRLASGSDDMTVRIWDIAEGTELLLLRGHTKKIMAVTFSQDALVVVSGSEDMRIRVWDAIKGSTLHTLLGHGSGINAVVFSPDNRFLASCSFDDDVRLWDAATFESRGQLEDFDTIEDINSGSATTSRSVNGTRGHPTVSDTLFTGHSTSITSVSFSPDGNLLASGSQDGIIKVWHDNVTRNILHNGHDCRINHLMFSPNSHLLAASSADKTVSIWDMKSQMMSFRFRGHSDDVSLASFSSDGKLLASCSADMTTRLWDVATGAQICTIKGHKGPVTDIAFSPNNCILATSSADKMILLWDLTNQTSFTAPLHVLSGHSASVSSITFSPDTNGDFLLSCSDDNTIRLWRLQTCDDGTTTPPTTVNMINDEVPVHCASISPDNRYVAFATADQKVGLWDLTKAAGGAGCGGTSSSSSSSSLSKKFFISTDDTTVRRVAFSSCGRYIHTDRGTLKTKSLFPSSLIRGPPESSSSSSFLPLIDSSTDFSSHHINTLLVGQEWITRNSVDSKFIWLPDGEFDAPPVVATRPGLPGPGGGTTIVMGHSSGAITFLKV